MKIRIDSRFFRTWGTAAALSIALAIFGCAAQDGAPFAGPQPSFPTPYGRPTTRSVTDVLEHIRARLDDGVRLRLVEATSRPINGGPETKYLALDTGAEHKFNPTQYPMGVAYAGLLAAGDATGDPAFDDTVAKRFNVLAEFLSVGPTSDGSASTRPFRNFFYPASLDDVGAMTTAMIRARRANVGPDLMAQIQRSADYVSKKQYRLEDGTLARKRPVNEYVWADDMFMGVSILSQMGALTGNAGYFDDACKQVIQISNRLWDPQTNLLTHGWTGENPDYQPHYYWGRANGWCLMAMADLIEVLPQDHPQRAEVLKRYRSLAKSIATYQSGMGLWHNMLDRNDSFLETSASGMFVYAIAKGVRYGWLNSTAYGPVALAGWAGLVTRVDDNGRLSGVCIGTGIGDDYTFYYFRPATDDVHGYGPVLLAGSEIIKMMKGKEYNILATTRATNSVMFIPKGEKP